MPKENIPGIYEKFIPLTLTEVYQDEINYDCTETIDENGKITYSQGPIYRWYYAMYDQIKIFLEDNMMMFI